jgi:signal peptidase II
LKRALILILLVLLADQALKVWVKLTFYYDQAVPLFGSWSYLHFIENRGMAFGMEFGMEGGKLALTLLRIIAVIGIGWWLRQLARSAAPLLQVMSVALVFAGALGNIIDSTFYGVIFSASTPFKLAELFPADGGYSSLFHGAVVDMFHFPLWRGELPDWIPGIGGRYFEFFQPVFNIADAAITVGIGCFILSHRRARKDGAEPDAPAEAPGMATSVGAGDASGTGGGSGGE